MTITIGIPTYECAKSLQTTIAHIKAAGAAAEQIQVVVDGDQYLPRLEKLNLSNVQIEVYSPRQGQSARINDIFAKCESDFLILTNDDVKWDKDALQNIIEVFQQTGADLITTQVKPLPATTFEEQVINFGAAVSNEVSLSHRSGQSYISCNGRMIALSRALYTSIRIPTGIWNNDAYIYFAAVLRGFRHVHCPEAICYYRSPLRFSEHYKQSVKFQVSKVDLQGYFKEDLSPYYALPYQVLIKAFFKVWIGKPFYGVVYVFVLLWSKFLSLVSPLKKVKLTYWETDASTKLL